MENAYSDKHRVERYNKTRYFIPPYGEKNIVDTQMWQSWLPAVTFTASLSIGLPRKANAYGWGGAELLMIRTSNSKKAEMVYVLRKPNRCNQIDTLAHSRKQGYALQSHPKRFTPQNHIFSTREAENKMGRKQKPSTNDILNINFLSPNEADSSSACSALPIVAGQPRKSQALIESHQTGCACDN